MEYSEKLRVFQEYLGLWRKQRSFSAKEEWGGEFCVVILRFKVLSYLKRR